MIQDPFRSMIRSEGVLRYRDLPWRRTRDPYIIWLSEVMLQQTQVPRVEARMPVWLDRFPTVQALAQPRLPMFWTLGRAWATTDALWRFTGPLSAL